jgi:hypothetical protein
LLPTTANTGAAVCNISTTSGPPTSPACKITSTPRRASSTADDTKPWVSEIKPTFITAPASSVFLATQSGQ